MSITVTGVHRYLPAVCMPAPPSRMLAANKVRAAPETNPYVIQTKIYTIDSDFKEYLLKSSTQVSVNSPCASVVSYHSVAYRVVLQSILPLPSPELAASGSCFWH